MKAAILTSFLTEKSFMSQLEECFSIKSLNSALDDLIDGHFDVIAERPLISTGADRVELDLFLRDKEKHLSAVERKVLSGRYTFSPFLERQIPKDGTKDMRTISIASIRDAVVQRVLYQYLYPFVDERLSEGVVFGYRKGVSAHDAIGVIRQHFKNGLTFVFEADLQKFFDNVNHNVLLEMVSELEIDERVATLIRRFLKTGKIPSKQVDEHRANKGKQRKYQPETRTIGVPQGGVLSGLLSNLYLSEFDANLLKEHRGLVRYADDFLVCCSDKEECRKAHSLARKLLLPLKVSLHPSSEKTKECVLAESGVEFLGFRVSPNSVRVRGRNIAKFKDRVKKVVSNQKVYVTPEKTLSHLCDRLSFKIRGPNDEQLQKYAERGKIISPCRRSWIGFFRIVDDIEQIRSLDRWIRRQVSQFMWKQHGYRVTLSDMQKHELPSLVNCLWKARKANSLEAERK